MYHSAIDRRTKWWERATNERGSVLVDFVSESRVRKPSSAQYRRVFQSELKMDQSSSLIVTCICEAGP